ncbi:MAG: TIGR00153 family protein [Candidatus Heimdallarchaeaceae archaeon]|nr:MAG: TIGR00153 family protein [Candidatus Neomarinimicrobiota bacterium]
MRLFFGGKSEKEVLIKTAELIQLLCSACEIFDEAIKKGDKNLMSEIYIIEKKGDEVRREIASKIYEGAFLPYLRPNIYKMAEMIDCIIDKLEDAALSFSKIKREDLLKIIKNEIEIISELNIKMCHVLSKSFTICFLKGGDLRETIILIRVLEKRVDDLKHSILDKIMREDVKFWEGIVLLDFIEQLVEISDLIEDVADIIQLLNLSL